METKEIQRTKCEVYSRVVGYLSEIHCWNNGKQSEWEVRKNYNV